MLAEILRDVVKDDVDFALMVFGDEGADNILEAVSKYVPLGQIPANLATIALGYLAAKYGDRIHPRLRAVGAGMLIRGIGDTVGDFIDQMFKSIMAGIKTTA